MAVDTATRTITKELLSLGRWTDSRGNLVDLRAGDLEQIIAASPRDVAVKLGHTSDEFNNLVAQQLGIHSTLLTGDADGNGQLRLGLAQNFRVENDRLLADLVLPEALADLVDRGMITNVSAEMRRGNPFVITAVALLGAQDPAMGNLRTFAGLKPETVVLLSKEEIRLMISPEQVISALQELLDQLQAPETPEEPPVAPEPPPPAAASAPPPAMAAAAAPAPDRQLSAQIKAQEARIQKMEQENADLRLAARQSHYRQLAATYPHLADAEQFAQRMAQLELTAPAEVTVILDTHAELAEAHNSSLLFTKMSVPGRVNPAAQSHPFLTKVDDIARADNLNLADRTQYARAFTKASDLHHDLFLQYSDQRGR